VLNLVTLVKSIEDVGCLTETFEQLLSGYTRRPAVAKLLKAILQGVPEGVANEHDLASDTALDIHARQAGMS
jgi:hypothetical protein